jgi:serine/threonine protein kinase
MRQILSVASFCHLQGVVHRDLKPEVSLIQAIQILFRYFSFVPFNFHSVGCL